MTTLERQWSEYRAYAQRRGIKISKEPYYVDNNMPYQYTIIFFEKRIGQLVYHTYRTFNNILIRRFFSKFIRDGIDELEAFIAKERVK